MKRRSPTAFNKSPDQQYKHCTHDRSNESRALIRAVSANGLNKVRGDERADEQPELNLRVRTASP